MVPVKEIRGLKCPNHEYARDNHHFFVSTGLFRSKT